MLALSLANIKWDRMMKKYAVSFLLFICGVASILSFQKISKYQKAHKTEKISEQVTMRLPTNPPFQQVLGQNREQMIELIRAFPKDAYQLFSVSKSGYFYLDRINSFDYIKSRLRKGKTWEEHLQKLIHQYSLPGSVVLDIGAHIGTLTLKMAQAVGPQGQVLAFEPQPKIFRELFLNMAINQLCNISFYSAGVGDREGSIELAPLVENNEGGTPLIGGTGEFVPLLTIDSLHLSNVSLMKIDVEGMEDQVIEGARETILANRPTIIIEIMGGNDFATASKEVRLKILQTIDKIEQLGYCVTQIRTHDWLATPKSEI